MVPPSNDALRQVIERDTDLVDSLNEFYGDAAADGGLDKIERELLLDLLGRHFTGQLWPRTGGMEATRRFMATLQRAMRRRRLEDGRVRPGCLRVFASRHKMA